MKCVRKADLKGPKERGDEEVRTLAVFIILDLYGIIIIIIIKIILLFYYLYELGCLIHVRDL